MRAFRSSNKRSGDPTRSTCVDHCLARWCPFNRKTLAQAHRRSTHMCNAADEITGRPPSAPPRERTRDAHKTRTRTHCKTLYAARRFAGSMRACSGKAFRITMFGRWCSLAAPAGSICNGQGCRSSNGGVGLRGGVTRAEYVAPGTTMKFVIKMCYCVCMDGCASGR